MSQQQRPKSVSSRKSSAAELDEEAYPMHIIVQNMMFAYGDSEMPLERCQEFMLNLLKQQLLKIVEDAKEIARIRGKTSVGYVEMIYQFRRHPVLIKRLIQYTRVQEFAPKLYNSLSAEEDATEAATSGEDLHEEKFRRGQSLFEAIRELDVTGELTELFNVSSSIDEAKAERMRRMAVRTDRMDGEKYERFASARMISFCSRKGKKSNTYTRRFLEWLGSPPVESGVVYLLNYCATEIVATIVDNAGLCRDQEPQDLFRNEHPSHSLQLRHYEEALRRNRGYSLRGSVLFGFF